MQLKGNADNTSCVKPSYIQVGDSVLVQREANNKSTPAYDAEPLQVEYRKDTRVVAKRPDGSPVTRTMAHSKKVYFGSMEEAHRWSNSEWPTEPVNKSTLSTREDGPLGLEQTGSMMGTGANEPISS